MNRVRSLTSTAVPEASDKDYEWNVASLLIPHEALRRELMRAKGALNNMSMYTLILILDLFRQLTNYSSTL